MVKQRAGKGVGFALNLFEKTQNVMGSLAQSLDIANTDEESNTDPKWTQHLCPTGQMGSSSIIPLMAPQRLL